jgi:hypothetical protein
VLLLNGKETLGIDDLLDGSLGEPSVGEKKGVAIV